MCLLVEPMCIPAAANPAAAAQHGCRPWQRGTARSRRWGAGASRERVPKCCPVPFQPVASSTGCAVLPAHPVHAQAPPVHVQEPQCMPSCPKPWHLPLHVYIPLTCPGTPLVCRGPPTPQTCPGSPHTSQLATLPGLGVRACSGACRCAPRCARVLQGMD